MGLFSKLPKACRGSSAVRSCARLCFARAVKGETEAFGHLAEGYFNLITEYLYLCNFDRDEALAATRDLLFEGWVRLPLLRSLDGWEAFLASRLLVVPVAADRTSENRRPKALVDLDPATRFALAAFDLESWSYRCLSRALQVEEHEVMRLLFLGRARVLDFPLEECSRKTRNFLERVSAELDGQVTPRDRQAILQRIGRYPEARAFRAAWLDYRCHLIEMRQQVRFAPEDRHDFLISFLRTLSPEDRARPSLFRRFKNMVAPASRPVVQTPRFGDS